MSNEYLGEKEVLKQGILPQTNLGALVGERIDLAVSARIAIVISYSGSAASSVDITLRQHDAATAGNSKDLSVSNNYYVKAGAALSFSKTEVAEDVPVAAYNLDAELSTDEGIAVFEIAGEDLDVNAGFNHLSVDLGAAGVAKIVSVMYHGHFPFKKSAHEVEA